MRWGTVLVGVVLTASDPRRTVTEVVIAAVLVAHAAVRTALPPSWRVRADGPTAILAETAGCYAAVALTGWWSSPFVFTVASGLVEAGFAGGFVWAVPLAGAVSAAVTLPSFRNTDSVLRLATQGSAEFLLTAMVAGYGRRLFGEAEQRTTTALDRLRGLTEANRLLQQLNALAQTLPASLDTRETVSETLGQVRALLRPDAATIFLWDGSLSQWSVAIAEGVRLPAVMDDASLPVPVRVAARAALHDASARRVDLTIAGPGLTPAARVGLYAPLFARRALVGVIAVEAQSADAFTPGDVELMTGVAEQAALAIDNAMWFGRLRTLGAEEERMRIARDLHDRVAQALAYLAFELDRIVDISSKRPVHEELGSLRHDVRRVVTEVRDTLYDLRTDVSEGHGLGDTMADFLERVEARSTLRVTFEQDAERRLPIPLERELWRIGQEAITNVERHARATSLHVRWVVRASEVLLEVLDDGRGFPLGTAGRMDSYGLLGMRERAGAIGATLDVDTAPGRGTAIRCRMEV
ncbi:MAG TPA: GAF domain-containing sensor histidine kinase [Acidimicrobiales bacterium]|nr:GAF domain-containing sensor histidine kinase [Acidimicrobiales bacterium]